MTISIALLLIGLVIIVFMQGRQIRQLEVEHDRLCMVMQESKYYWTKASDRLPPENHLVLAVDQYGEVDSGYYVRGYYAYRFISPREIATPTHWTEMPEPPNSGEGVHND